MDDETKVIVTGKGGEVKAYKPGTEPVSVLDRVKQGLSRLRSRRGKEEPVSRSITQTEIERSNAMLDEFKRTNPMELTQKIPIDLDGLKKYEQQSGKGE